MKTGNQAANGNATRGNWNFLKTRDYIDFAVTSMYACSGSFVRIFILL